MNLGVGGYGTDRPSLQYLVQGRLYAPRLVVLTVFKNDPIENAHTVFWGVEKPRFYLDGGRLCLGNVPPARAPGWPNNRLLADREPSLRLPGTGIDLARSATARFFMRREWLPSLLAKGDGGLSVVRPYIGCVRNRAVRGRRMRSGAPRHDLGRVTDAGGAVGAARSSPSQGAESPGRRRTYDALRVLPRAGSPMSTCAGPPRRPEAGRPFLPTTRTVRRGQPAADLPCAIASGATRACDGE